MQVQLPPIITCKLQVIAIQHNTPVLITSDCNQCNQLRDRQALQFFPEFAHGEHKKEIK